VLLARNWRTSGAEVDLIIARGRVLVFCEVKTRSGSGYGLPFEAVTPAKQARIRRAAAAWLRSAERPRSAWNELRFDVASVKGGIVDVLEAAF
jgi:putative endonuclease